MSLMRHLVLCCLLGLVGRHDGVWEMNMGSVIYVTRHFTARLPRMPHVLRADGGHVFIEANDRSVSERTQLTAEQAIELVWLTMLVGQAYWDVMPSRGLDLYRLNYQDNGNWAFARGEQPVLHVHVYGRTCDERHQEYGQALHLPDVGTGFYDGFEPLTDDDVLALREHMEMLAKTEGFRWGQSPDGGMPADGSGSSSNSRS